MQVLEARRSKFSLTLHQTRCFLQQLLKFPKFQLVHQQNDNTQYYFLSRVVVIQKMTHYYVLIFTNSYDNDYDYITDREQ